MIHLVFTMLIFCLLKIKHILKSHEIWHGNVCGFVLLNETGSKWTRNLKWMTQKGCFRSDPVPISYQTRESYSIYESSRKKHTRKAWWRTTKRILKTNNVNYTRKLPLITSEISLELLKYWPERFVVFTAACWGQKITKEQSTGGLIWLYY